MTALGLVKVLEGRLKEDPIGIHQPSDLLESVNHDILFLVCEILYKVSINILYSRI